MRRWDRPGAFPMRWSVGCLLQVPNISFNYQGSLISRWHIGLAGHRLFLLLFVLCALANQAEQRRMTESLIPRRELKE